VELYENKDNEDFPIEGRKVLYFTFKFNDNILITAPTIFLNCKSEKEKLEIGIIY